MIRILKRALGIQSQSKQLMGAYDEFEKKQMKSKIKKKEVKDDFHKMLIDEQEQLDKLEY